MTWSPEDSHRTWFWMTKEFCFPLYIVATSKFSAHAWQFCVLFGQLWRIIQWHHLPPGNSKALIIEVTIQTNYILQSRGWRQSIMDRRWSIMDCRQTSSESCLVCHMPRKWLEWRQSHDVDHAFNSPIPFQFGLISNYFHNVFLLESPTTSKTKLSNFRRSTQSLCFSYYHISPESLVGLATQRM